MQVLEMCSLNYAVNCYSCKSVLSIEPCDWKYIPAQRDYSGFMDDPCLVTNCCVCNKQIVLEERMKGKSGIYNAIKHYLNNSKTTENLKGKMKQLYQTVDGKIFQEKTLAQEHEKEIIKKSQERINLLEQLEVFKFFKVGEIVQVSCNYDDAGNSTKREKLEGSKENIITHIAVNHKYWNIGNRVEIKIWENDIIKL